MAWYNPFTWSSVTGGIDLDAEKKRTEELNAKKAALDEEAYRRGIWTDEDRRFVEQQAITDAEAWNPDRYDAEVTAAAAEGAREGLANIQTTVKDTVTSAAGFGIGGVLGFIPWWGWIIGAGYLAFRFGLLKGVLAKVPGLKAP